MKNSAGGHARNLSASKISPKCQRFVYALHSGLVPDAEPRVNAGIVGKVIHVGGPPFGESEFEEIDVARSHSAGGGGGGSGIPGGIPVSRHQMSCAGDEESRVLAYVSEERRDRGSALNTADGMHHVEKDGGGQDIPHRSVVGSSRHW